VRWISTLGSPSGSDGVIARPPDGSVGLRRSIRLVWEQTSQTVPMRTLAVAAAVVAGAIAAAGSGVVNAAVPAAMVVAAGVATFRRRPDLGFVAWIFLAPYFQSLGRRSETPAESAAKIGIYFGPPLVFALWALFRMCRPKVRLGNLLDLLPALFVLLAVVTVATAPSEYGVGPPAYGAYTRVDLLQQLYISVAIGVICFYVCVLAPLRAGIGERIATALVSTSIAVSAMVFVEKATGWNLWHYTYWHTKSVSRMTGPLLSPAALGSFLGMVVVLALALLLWGSRSSRRLAGVALALGIPALLLAYQRSCILAVAVVGAIMLGTRRRARVVAAGVAAASAIAIAAAWGPISHSHLYRARIANVSTPEIRKKVTASALKAFRKRPLLGWGYGSFDVVHRSLPTHLGPQADLGEIYSAPPAAPPDGVRPPITVSARIVTPVQGWVAMRVRVEWGSRPTPSVQRTFFSWYGDDATNIRIVYEAWLRKFVLVRVAGGHTAFAVSSPQRFAPGSVHTIAGVWSPHSIGVSVDGSALVPAVVRIPLRVYAPLLTVGAVSGNISPARATFMWLAAGRGAIGGHDLEILARLPNRLSGGASLKRGYNVPRFRFTSHNTFLTILVELGLFGLLLFLLPWVTILGRAISRALRDPRERALQLGFAAAVAVYVINALFVDMRFFSFIPALPWIALGLVRRYQLDGVGPP
jgi:O-antigen ligase